MGQVRTESAEINGVTYTTKTFSFSAATNLYVDIATVIPQEVLAIIMLPAANIIELKREELAAKARAAAGGVDPEEENPDEDPLVVLRAAASVTVAKMLRMFETPGVLATMTHTVIREAANYPGGLASLMKLILAQTSAAPIRVAPGMQGKSDMVVPHMETHFDSDIGGVQDAVEVCFWVMRLNFVKPSSAAS